MSVLIKGNTHQVAVKVVGESDVVDQSGKRNITCIWEVDYANKETFIASVTTYAGLKRSSVRAERMKLNIARVTMTFSGLDPAEISWGFKKTYKQGVAYSTEPIETHPKFFEYAGYPNPTTEAGKKHIGKANADGTGADMNGFWKAGDKDNSGSTASSATFVGWRTDTATGKKFQGLTQYRNPTITWTETIVSTNRIYTNMRVGTIDSPPGSPPSVSKYSGNRNWMLVSAEQDENGSAWTTTRTWEMSGEAGWLTEWYNAS